jgi:anti-sigma factor RsiW
MMRCEEALRLLDDHIDGTLTPDLSAAVTAHLAGCAACRRAEIGTRAVLSAASELPAAIEPARDLWPGIAGRLGAAVVPLQPSPAVSWRRRWAPLAAAAALLVAATAVVTARWVGPGRAAGAPAGHAAVVPAKLAGDPALAAAVADYERAAVALRGALARHRSAMAPDTARVVESNLQVVDAAIADLTRAVAANPNDRDLTLLLASTYQRQIELLQTANTLSQS